MLTLWGGLLIFIANESWLWVNVNMCVHYMRTKTTFSPLVRTFIADDEEENGENEENLLLFAHPQVLIFLNHSTKKHSCNTRVNFILLKISATIKMKNIIFQLKNTEVKIETFTARKFKSQVSAKNLFNFVEWNWKKEEFHSVFSLTFFSSLDSHN